MKKINITDKIGTAIAYKGCVTIEYFDKIDGKKVINAYNKGQTALFNAIVKMLSGRDINNIARPSSIDLFDYILPAGITYSFIRVNNVTYDKETNFVVVKHLDNDSGYNKLSIEESSSLLEVQNVADIDGEQGKYLGNIGSTIVVNIENKAENTEGGN